MAWMERMREGWHWALSTPIGQELAQRARARAEREMDRLIGGGGQSGQPREPPATEDATEDATGDATGDRGETERR